MNLSKRHKAIFDEKFPDGYSTDKITERTGDVVDESGYFHIMYVNILKDGERTRDVPYVQKYSVSDWEKTKKLFETHKIKAVTGHSEYSVIHDPTAKAREAKAEVKPETKRPGRPPQK